MKVTKEFIESGMSERGGWNKAQFECLGIPWPPQGGWKRKIIGAEITQEKADLFLALKGKTLEPPRDN